MLQVAHNNLFIIIQLSALHILRHRLLVIAYKQLLMANALNYIKIKPQFRTWFLSHVKGKICVHRVD